MRAEHLSFYRGLGRRIRKARTAAGLSQHEVGSMMSPSHTRASVANMEAAKQALLAHQLKQLGRILRVSPAWLLMGIAPEVKP